MGVSQIPGTSDSARGQKVVCKFKQYLRPVVRLCLLPVRLYRRGRRQISRALNHSTQYSTNLVVLRERFDKKGPDAADQWARNVTKNKRQLCTYLSNLARMCVMLYPERAVKIAEEVAVLDPRPFRKCWLAMIHYDAGNVQSAASLLRSEDLSLFSAKEREKAQYILGCDRLLGKNLTIPERVASPLLPENKRSIVYVASSSMPYHVSGYTTRTHSILTALKNQGWMVTCVTRPGYPEDRDDCIVNKVHNSVTVDGIEYISLAGPHRRRVPLDQYLEKSASILVEFLENSRPSIVQAASNYEAALPAMLASKKLGVPFVYEVRGLWEYTAASKRNNWEETERFALDKQLESQTVSQANWVFTLTNALAEELISRGARPGSISLAPNAVDPSEFKQLQYDKSLADKVGISRSTFTIGYIGSLVSYEGLDDLLKALRMLLERDIKAVLLIVGNGTATESLKKLAASLGIKEQVRFVGRVSPKEVPGYMSLLDVITLPRKPVRVCELVSPLKPLEAMASKVPMIVSSVPALAEMVVDGETALIHRAGDPGDLCKALEMMANNPEIRVCIANQAYDHVILNRTWDSVVCRVTEVLNGLALPDPLCNSTSE